MDRDDLPARERILATAHDLFYAEGIRATGVDRLIAQASVAKLTFYRHFPSKDDLVREFLARRHDAWMAWFVDALGRHGARSGGGLAPLVAVMREWFERPDFRGCAFINAVAEATAVAEVDSIARKHKSDMARVIGELLPARAAGSRAARADAAAVAVDGAIVRAQIDRPAPALAALRLLLAGLEAS